MKLVIDMSLSPIWAEYLGANSIAAAHWQTIGDPRATDFSIMEHARRLGLIVFTHDLDFGSILAATNVRVLPLFR